MFNLKELAKEHAVLKEKITEYYNRPSIKVSSNEISLYDLYIIPMSDKEEIYALKLAAIWSASLQSSFKSALIPVLFSSNSFMTSSFCL